MKNKLLLSILFVLIFLLISFSAVYIYFFKSNIDESSSIDNNVYVSDLSKKVHVNNLTFSDTIFEKTINGDNELDFVITNSTNKDIQLSGFNILLKDRENNIIETIECYEVNVKSGVSFSYSVLVSSKIEDVYCVEYISV